MRLQPNHRTDSLRGIAASMLDGLLCAGGGDAVVGINPASDSLPLLEKLNYMLDDVIQRFAIPTQSCVLTHVTNTLRLIEAARRWIWCFSRSPVPEAANRSFGINLALEETRRRRWSLRRGTLGDNVMYFETGQGSCLSANAHHGVDQQNLRGARLCGGAPFLAVADQHRGRVYRPRIPCMTANKLSAPGWRDHFCGKAAPGCRWAATSATPTMPEADPDDMDTLLTLLAAAGLTFLIGVPGADDIMLNYQSVVP